VAFPNAGGMFHHSLAFGDRKLTKQEEALARFGSDPVRIAATGIQECRLCRPGCFLGELDQFVFNLERA